jgi:hypothetical protein
MYSNAQKNVLVKIIISKVAEPLNNEPPPVQSIKCLPDLLVGYINRERKIGSVKFSLWQSHINFYRSNLSTLAKFAALYESYRPHQGIKRNTYFL